jgi:hypothetical protein
MPSRWSRKPDRKDHDYRRLDDIMNFAVHVAFFAASNSGLWFFNLFLDRHWIWAAWVTEGWGAILLAHALYVFAIARYSDPVTADTSAGAGFVPKSKSATAKSTSTKSAKR